MNIPGYDKYDITEDGVVTRIDSGRVLRPYINVLPNGKKYRHVSLISNDSDIAVPHNVMRLLAITYLPPRPKNYIACAKDGNSLNTVVTNVEWCDRASVARKYNNPNRKKRTSSHCTIETTERLREAMLALDETMSMTTLANILEVPYSTVRYSMQALIKGGKAKNTTRGYEVIA